MAIGLGLAFLQVDIVHTAMTIGLMTMIMATIGMMIGRYVGPLLGKSRNYWWVGTNRYWF